MPEWLPLGELILVVVGFALGLVGNISLEERRERQQARRVRLLLRLEIEGNLRELGRYWEEVDKESAEKVAKHLVVTPFPAWSDAAWKAQVALVPAALDEREIEGTQRLYAGLAKLETLRRQLTVFALEDAADRRAGEQAEAASISDRFVGGLQTYFSPLRNSKRYDEAAPTIGQEAVSLVGGLMRPGNPLARPQARSRWRFWQKTRTS